MSTHELKSPGIPERQTNTAYDLVWADIVAGRFEPGTKLRIDQLCAQYGLGTSPMREALTRLAETGLLVSEPQRGFWIAPVSLTEYEDLVRLRINLESQALAESIRNGDVEWEAQVVAAYHRLSRAHGQLAGGGKESFVRFAREDRAFHMTTLSRCKSPWLLRFCRMILEQFSRYHRQRYLVGLAPGDKTEKEHDRLMKAILARDVQQACEHLKAHVIGVAARLSKDSLPESG